MNRRQPSPRPGFEVLEDRTLPAALTPTILTDSGDGSGSLRDVVRRANSNNEDDVITLAAGTYPLTLPNVGIQENAAATGDLDLTEAGRRLVIEGRGAGLTVIAAAFPSTPLNDRLFQVFPNVTVEFRNLTLRGGLAQDDGTAGTAPGLSTAKGGAVLLDGATATFDGVVVEHNEARGGTGVAGTDGTPGNPSSFGWSGKSAAGGGIANFHGSLTLKNSLLQHNLAQGGTGGAGGAGGDGLGGPGGYGGEGGRGMAGFGGGLHVESATELILINSTVAWNQARGGEGGRGGDGGNGSSLGRLEGMGGQGGYGGRGVAAVGGGVNVEATRVTLSNVTISSNQARGGPGGSGGAGGLSPAGQRAEGGRGGNGGEAYCGGFWTASAVEVFTCANSTIAFNLAQEGNGGAGGLGAEGFVGSPGSGYFGGALASDNLVRVFSTLIARNQANTSPDFAGVVDEAANILIQNGSGATGIMDGVNGNRVGVDPQLGPLQDNGGPTPIHALMPGSPAINGGSNPFGLATDQRGFPRVSGGAADIGAFELFVSPPAPPGAPPAPLPAPLAIAAQVVRVKGRSLVQVLDAATGRRRAVLKPFGNFKGRIKVVLVDVNHDGLADLVVRARINKKLRKKAYNAIDLSPLPASLA